MKGDRMDKDEINNLIDRFLSGAISNRDKEKLDNWYASFEVLDDYTDGMRKEEQSEMRDKILIAIQSKVATEEVKPKRRVFIKAVSAAAFVLIGVLFSFYYFGTATVKYQTGKGEVIYLQLPDGSNVSLNGNSQIEYKLDWFGDFPRIVGLKGEAFFEIAHTESNEKFLVNHGNGMVVEVHGTAFNLNSRGSKQQITLKSGSINLLWDVDMIGGSESFMMKPGQMAQFDNKEHQYKVYSPENLVKYYSWTNGKLLLDQTRLEDILSIIRDSHGVEVVLADRLSATKTASGSLPVSNDSRELTENIAALFDLEIENDGKQVRFK